MGLDNAEHQSCPWDDRADQAETRKLPGQVVLADVPFAGTTCKRLVKEGRKLYLVAESSGSYPRIEVGPEVRIVGVVTAAWLAVEF